MEEEIEENEDIGTWQDDAANIKNFDFSESNQMLVDFPADSDPYEYFRILLEIVINQSNEYAVEVFTQKRDVIEPIYLCGKS